MTKVFSKSTITSIAISTLFILSGVGASVLINPVGATPNASSAPLAATPLTAAQANWAAPDGGVSGGAMQDWNYNPQNQINSSNAQSLGISWLFPVPGHPTSLLGISAGLGVAIQPMVYNGVLYATTQDGQVFALNAANGNTVWSKTIPLSPTSIPELTQTDANGITLFLHNHPGSIAFTTTLFGGTPAFWIQAPNRIIYVYNANNGAALLNFSYFNPGGTGPTAQLVGDPAIKGNNPNTQYGRYSNGLIVDQSKGIVITSMTTSSSNNAARCYFTAWNVNVNPPTRMWVDYCSPPQIGSAIGPDPNWDMKQVNNMTGAEIFYPGNPQCHCTNYDNGGTIPGSAVVNLKTLSASVLNSTLYNDWGQINQTPACSASDGGGSPGATGSGWGAPWLVGSGTTAGIAIINTGNRGPYTSPCNPGPDLWSSAIMAMNETTGNWIWGFQAIAHDELDYDCSEGQALGNATVNGALTQVVWKTCKSGYLFELNALTGNLIWAWEPPSNIGPRCPYCFPHNPLNATEMNEGFANPSYQNTLLYPVTSGFEADLSYNPTLNYVFVASESTPNLEHYVPLNASNYGGTYGMTGIGTSYTGTAFNNATLEAINAANGSLVWHDTFLATAYRGGVSNSGNVVFTTWLSGDVRMFNAQTGTLIKDLYIGGPDEILPSIGATTAGTEEVFLSINTGIGSTSVPGDLVALTLQGVPSTSVSATTTTQTATVTASGATSTVTVGASVTSTVTASGATSTVTASGATKTVTATGPGATATATATATVTASGTSSGVSSTTLYGVAAVAVIFIIATGYLAMRGRKPAS
jgi:outer membrane protein assembly factor BamB